MQWKKKTHFEEPALRPLRLPHHHGSSPRHLRYRLQDQRSDELMQVGDACPIWFGRVSVLLIEMSSRPGLDLCSFSLLFIHSISFFFFSLYLYSTILLYIWRKKRLTETRRGVIRDGGGYGEGGKACESGWRHTDVAAKVQSSERHASACLRSIIISQLSAANGSLVIAAIYI